MKLVELKCKNCGARLKVQEDAKEVTCEFCKTTFKIDDEIKHVQYDNMEQSGYEFEKGRIKAQQELRLEEERAYEEEQEKARKEWEREYQEQYENNEEYSKTHVSPKSKTTTFLLCFIGLFGLGGLHEFYLGKTIKGIIKLVTLNFIYFGTVIDLILIASNKFKDKEGLDIIKG